MLARYACDPAHTRGRRIVEPPSPPRTEYQRDRDRIVHSTAFRRLVYKTQVFVNHEGDLFRTRLTHSLEVAQLGRSIARTLQLNEDLVEAIALAHDLGHTPFGHAGQDALHDCMKEYGGFEHNLQSLRVVDRLEQRYPAFDGLNLCLETREGLLKRCPARVAAALEAAEPDGVARRFLAGQQASLEAQLINLADEIAYNAHDIDDGVRSGLLAFEPLQAVPLFMQHCEAARTQYPQLAQQPRRLLAETLRRMLSAQVQDAIAATQAQIEHHRPHSADAVRRLPPLVCFSEPMREQSAHLKRFLFAGLYRHPQVTRTTERACDIVRALFAAYVALPTQMPDEQASGFDRRGHRVVADYIAGMTDRFASREYARLTGRQAFALPSAV
ncbi:MAG: deoxyguanosinetriphosphate triphosphohydrolase [Burkholderiaceae bacterium]|nr:deoxyguanosinetriphosphate triphosphohydrolase [Burkholderiaceae bacterium]